MTENELTDLDKLLLRREKIAKAWTFARWMNVVLGLLVLGCGVWLLMKAPDAWRAEVTRDVSTPVDAFDLMSTRNSTIYCCLLWVVGIFHGTLGGILVASSLCHWRKGHHDLLLVKMARAWVESQQAVPPSAP